MIAGENILSLRDVEFNKILKISMSEFYDMIEKDSNKIKPLYKVFGYEILSPYGWSDIQFVNKYRNLMDKYIVRTSSHELVCCKMQNLLVNGTKKTKVNELKIGDMITTEYGLKEVTDVVDTGEKEIMFDIKAKTHLGYVFIGGILVN